MLEADKHEWASGVHASIFSLLVGGAAIVAHSRTALALILLSQALAYLQRLALLIDWPWANPTPESVTVLATGAASVLCAIAAAIVAVGWL